MSWAIRLPVSDPDEQITSDTILDLPNCLDDPEDQQVTAALLWCAKMAAPDRPVSVKQVSDIVERLDQPRRKTWLDALRKIVGLPTREEVELAQRQKVAQERARQSRRTPLLRFDPHTGGWVALHEDDELKVTWMPSGGYVPTDEIETARSRAQTAARSLEVEREAQRAERGAAAEMRIDSERVAWQRMLDELPEHLRPKSE